MVTNGKVIFPDFLICVIQLSIMKKSMIPSQFALSGQAGSHLSQGKQCRISIDVFGCGRFSYIAIWMESLRSV